MLCSKMALIPLLVLASAVTALAEQKFVCFDETRLANWTKAETDDIKFALPSLHQVRIKNGQNKTTSLLREFVAATTTNSGIVKVAPGGKEYRWLFQDLSKYCFTENHHNCSCGDKFEDDVKQKGALNAFEFPISQLPTGTTIRSLNDFFEMARKALEKANLYKREIVNINAKNKVLTACFDIGPDPTSSKPRKLELNIRYGMFTSVDEGSPFMISMSAYVNGTDPKENEAYSVDYAVAGQSAFYDAAGMQRIGEAMTQPAEGVHCKGFKPTVVATMPDWPKKFSLHYASGSGSAVANDQKVITYDTDRKLISISFDQATSQKVYNKNAAANLTGGLIAGTMDPAGVYTIVQDYAQRVSYQLKHASDGSAPTCQIANLPTVPTAVSRATKDSTSTYIALRTPLEILTGVRNTNTNLTTKNCTYIGKKYTHATGQLLKRFSTFIDDHVETAGDKFDRVVDLYFIDSSYAVSSGAEPLMKPVPLAITVTSEKEDNTAGVHSLVNYTWHYYLHDTVTELDTSHYDDLAYCLQTNTNRSFLAFSIGVVPDKTATLAKLQAQKQKIREDIAAKAGVPFYRISPISVNKNAKDELVIMFTMYENATLSAETHKVPVKPFDPSQAAVTMPDFDLGLDKAVAKLNDSIGDLTVAEIKIPKQSLRFTRSFYSGGGSGSTQIVKQGYTGGSVAAAAIIMLLIGLGGGYAFLHYRQRRANIAYHVYES